MICTTAPASKSLSHRYLTAAALANGTSHLTNVLDSDDTTRTREILAQAGALFEETGRDAGPTGGVSFKVQGTGGKPMGAPANAEPLSCYANLSGTTCRLLTGVLAAGRGRFRICGAKRLEERPIGELVRALRALGVDVTCERAEGFPPLCLETSGLKAPEGGIPISMDESSQYFSGLLLAAPMADAPLTLHLEGTKVVSWPYIGLTLQCLADFGIPFRVETRCIPEDANNWALTPWREIRQAMPHCLRITVQPAIYQAGDFAVEGDWSGASYFVAAGAIGKEPVRIEGLRADSLQGDRALVDILASMGASIAPSEDGKAIVVTPSPLHGIEVDMGQCPDLVPTVAAAAVFAQGDTIIRNVAHLRIKECDRIAAPAEGIRRIGGSAEEREDGLIIHGLGTDAALKLKGVRFLSSNDHRMAMSQALYSLRASDVSPAEIMGHIDEPGVVKKSFPGFWQAWRAFA